MDFTAIEQLKAEQESIHARGVEAVKNVFKSFFAEHPKIKSIRWAQYAPYFNDGDPCVFHVRSFKFSPDGESWWCDGYWEDSDGDEAANELESPETLTAAFEDFENAMTCDIVEQSLQVAFGDDCEVVATREGFEVGETDHD